jgi:hypothetical protein
VRANLDGLDLATRYQFPLTNHVLEPVITELPAETGLPRFACPTAIGTRTRTGLVLHGSWVFSRIRKFIYKSPAPQELCEIVHLHVHSFVSSALAQLKLMQA